MQGSVFISKGKKMKKALLFSIAVIAILMSCGSDDGNDVTGSELTSVVGHSYSAMNFNDCLIYTFNSDGSIRVEKRSGSESGSLEAEGTGRYSVSGLTMKLDVPSSLPNLCEDCFNHFTATISSDYRSFSYEQAGNMKMTFKIIK